MGGLTSSPKIPKPKPQVIYVSQPAASTSTANSGSTDAGTGTSSQDNSATDADTDSGSVIRRQSLIDRERGRFGTVTTGFRGLLNALNNDAQRKTLLGE